MPRTQRVRRVVVLIVGGISYGIASWCIAEETSKPVSSAPAPVAAVASERIVVDDVVYRLERDGLRLVMVSQALASPTATVKRANTNFEAEEGRVISQIMIAPFRDKGVIAALKLTIGDKAEFVEMAFWHKEEKVLTGQCSSFKFLITDKSYILFGVSSRNSRGVFVTVGKDNYDSAEADVVTEGYLYLDGCPWPCNGGILSRFRGKSFPFDAPPQWPLDDTME